MDNIQFHKSSEKGQGLPFAILSNKDHPFLEDDFYSPSLRDFHVIFWFKKGQGKYFIDFKEYNFKPNSIVFLSKDQVHNFEKPTGDWEVLSIPFNPDIIYRNDGDLRHLFNFNISCHLEGQQILYLDGKDVAFLSQITATLQEVYQTWEGKTLEDAFYHGLSLLLIYCEKLQVGPPPLAAIKTEEDTRVLLRFSELLEKHFKAERSVSFYVEHLNISGKTLARITHNQYKISPKQVINERVILEMKRLLKGSGRSIKQIAYSLGFGEPTNMVKYFKKYTGQTPTAFKLAN